MWTTYRICYAELLLSLNRLTLLLNSYSMVQSNSEREISGEFTTSFNLPLGTTHLTLSIEDDKIVYFNHIPVKMTNMAGLTRILSQNDDPSHPLILPVYDPLLPL